MEDFHYQSKTKQNVDITFHKISIELLSTNVRECQSGNKKWTIQRN
jgi:hypothetical protein